MATDPAPSLFELSIGELTPNDTIVDETAAWESAHTDEGMESRTSDYVVDSRGNGKLYVVNEIRPLNTSSPPSGAWQYSIRFYRYDMATKAVDHVSYVKAIVNQSTSSDDFRAPGIAFDKTTGDLWCMYYESGDDDDEPFQSAADELFVKKSDDGGQTWGTETSVSSLGSGMRFGGDNYQRAQIQINASGEGLMLYCVRNTSTAVGTYYSRSLSSGTWGTETVVYVTGAVFSDASLPSHTLALLDDGDAICQVYQGVGGGDNTYRYFLYSKSSGLWSHIDDVDIQTASQTKRLSAMAVTNLDKTTVAPHVVEVWAESNGGAYAVAITKTKVHTVETLSQASSLGAINGADGDDIGANFDSNGDLIVFVSSGSTGIQRLGWARYRYSSVASTIAIDEMPGTPDAEDLLYLVNTSGDEGYYEANQDPCPNIIYRGVAMGFYSTDVHLLLMARRQDGASATNYMSVWEVVGEELVGDEAVDPVTTETGEGGYLWIQSRADSRDTIVASSGAEAVSEIATEVQLHPIYGPDRFRFNRWLLFVLRYTNWGLGDLALSWWGDNRPTQTRNVTMNPAALPNPTEGPAQSGEVIAPPRDIRGIRPVHVRTGGAALNLKLTSTQGRYSLRGFQLDFEVTKRQVTPGIFPYNQPQDAEVIE